MRSQVAAQVVFIFFKVVYGKLSEFSVEGFHFKRKLEQSGGKLLVTSRNDHIKTRLKMIIRTKKHLFFIKTQ